LCFCETTAQTGSFLQFSETRQGFLLGGVEQQIFFKLNSHSIFIFVMNDLLTTYDNDKNKDITIHKFTYNQQQNIIKLYNDNDNKIIAMQYIRLLPNCHNLNENDILHWMSKAKTGKSISVEFENEVMLACKKLDFFFNNHNKNNNNKSYSYTTIRECAKKIFDKDYWDDSSKSFIKKWHHDKRTCKLLFTNKWVTGMLKRRNNSYSSRLVSSANISLSSSSSDSLSSTSLPPPSSLPLHSSNALKSLQPSEASTIINAISHQHLSPHSLININACKYYQPHHYHYNDDFDTVMESSPDFFGDSSSISTFEFQDWIEFDSPL